MVRPMHTLDICVIVIARHFFPKMLVENLCKKKKKKLKSKGKISKKNKSVYFLKYLFAQIKKMLTYFRSGYDILTAKRKYGCVK